MNLSTLTPSEAHRLVVNWVKKNHIKFPYKKEVVLRETLVEFAKDDKRNPNAFAEWLSQNFPKFFEDVFMSGRKNG